MNALQYAGVGIGIFLIYSFISACPPGWKLFDHTTMTRCYKYFSGHRNWGDARATCQGSLFSGGDLASVPDQDTNDFLFSDEITNGRRSWIGGQRVGVEWTWNDGTPWDFENWSPGEPDNKHNRQAHLTINHWRPEKWDDDYYDSPGVRGFTCRTQGRYS